MPLIYGQNERCRTFLSQRIAQVPAWDERAQTIGLEIAGRLTAVVIFENFNTHDIEMSLAVEGRATPAFVRAAFDYPFKQLRCRRVTAMVGANLPQAQKLVKRLGFALEGRKRDATPAGDQLIFGLLKSECRYRDS